MSLVKMVRSDELTLLAAALFGGGPLSPNDYRREAPPWRGPGPAPVGTSNYQDTQPPWKGPGPEPVGTNYETESPGLTHPSIRESSPRGGMEGTHVEGWRISRHFNADDPRYTAYHAVHDDGSETRVVYDRKADTYHEIRPDRPSEPHRVQIHIVNGLQRGVPDRVAFYDEANKRLNAFKRAVRSELDIPLEDDVAIQEETTE